MLRNPLSFLYGSTAATFESQHSLDESVRRLERITKRTSFSAITSQQAVGRVTEEKVVLQRAIPFVGNSFKPYFVGRFERTREGVILRGKFTMHWLIKAFLTYWFGFCLLWTVLASYAVLTSEKSDPWWFPLVGIGMFAFGAGTVQMGKFFARNDIAWLSNVIKSVLSTDMRPNNSFKPTPLRGAA